MPAPLQCHGCRHHAWTALDSDRCSAFPDGIPDLIWRGDVDHSVPFPGDGGVLRAGDEAARARGLEARHDAWKKRAVERFTHGSDPLGAIVAGLDENPFGVPLDAVTLSAAWHVTNDAPAMLLVLMRAGRRADIARAVRMTAQQLELEGCDYVRDKGWLGVGLCLASYQTESSLESGRAAWAALSSPFGDGYLTTRVQQTLVRALRRVVPEPPPAVEWARPEAHVAGVGPLDESVVAMRLAPKKNALRIEYIALLEPWTEVKNAQGLEAELARELVEGHRLHGRAGLRAVARRTDCDDVLFVSDSLAAVVHLTWAKDVEPAHPATEIFASLEDWVTRRMDPDHDAFAGQVPRAFAFELRSTLCLEEMREKLPQRARWEWTVRDSAWYGDYVWAKDGATRVRIFAEDEPGRFTLQVDLVDAEHGGEDWFATAKALATEAFLPAIEATNVVSTTPRHD